MSNFAIDDNIPVPEAARRLPGSKYPFDVLGVHQSFHIPATAEDEDPAASHTSMVSHATAIRSPKHFFIRKAAANDPRGPGARVFRGPDFTPDEIAKREADKNARANKRAANEAALTPEQRAERDAKRAAAKAAREAAKNAAQ